MRTHKTIKQLLEGKIIYEPENTGSLKTLKVLKTLGFSDDYVPSYNVLKFGYHILDLFATEVSGDKQYDLFLGKPENKEAKDFLWLCNQFSKVVQARQNTEERTAFRVCRGREMAYDYICTRDWSIRGNYERKFKDKVITNPETGNQFCLGWTYEMND